MTDYFNIYQCVTSFIPESVTEEYLNQIAKLLNVESVTERWYGRQEKDKKTWSNISWTMERPILMER